MTKIQHRFTTELFKQLTDLILYTRMETTTRTTTTPTTTPPIHPPLQELGFEDCVPAATSSFIAVVYSSMSSVNRCEFQNKKSFVIQLFK